HLLLKGLSMDLAPYRLRMPLFVLAAALSGCAATDTGQQAANSPLVAYTAVGSGQPQRAQPVTAQAESTQSRPRALSPIRERPTYEDDAVPSRQPGGQTGGQRTTLNFNEAELHGVVRALAQFTGRNFVVDPRVRGQLTLMSEAPVDADTAYSM